MPAMLQRAVEDFFSRHLRADDIDRLPHVPGREHAKRADYLIDGRRTIVEVKSLEDDRQKAVQKVMDRWRAQLGYPILFDAPDLGTVARFHPEGAVMLRQVAEAMARPLEQHLRSANQQIRESRKTYGIPQAAGILVLLNEDVDCLDPPYLVPSINRLLWKRSGNESAYPCIESVLLISLAHRLLKDGKQWECTFSFGRGTANELRARALAIQWAAFRGVPLIDNGRSLSAEQMAQQQYVAIGPMGRIDLTALPPTNVVTSYAAQIEIRR
jgi:hypothetical protein